MVPETAPPTPRIDVDGTRVAATPFSATYAITGDPSEEDFNEAAELTTNYLDQVFTDTFGLSPFATLVQFAASPIGNTGTGDPASIGFEAVVVFSEDSNEIPDQEEIDVLIANAFQPPAVDDLVASLSGTAPNVFSTTSEITYSTMNVPQNGEEPVSPMAEKSNPLPFLGAFSALFATIAAIFWIHSTGKLRKVTMNDKIDCLATLDDDDLSNRTVCVEVTMKSMEECDDEKSDAKIPVAGSIDHLDDEEDNSDGWTSVESDSVYASVDSAS